MTDQMNEQELNDRLSLIEGMIAEGRRHTQNWGWAFVLWGIVYYVAIAWAAWGRSPWAWPVAVAVGVAATIAIGSSRGSGHPKTTLGRAIGSIWIGVGISMSVLFFALGASGRLTDQHVFIAVASAMLGMANGASAILLRWKVQLACAIVWWAAAVGATFGSDTQSQVAFLVAIFLCQIAFGIYGTIAQGRNNKPRITAHA
ncbi:MAG TPA: hypothetical protein VIY69_18405 [Candidatus Acidoferrales bacterium]